MNDLRKENLELKAEAIEQIAKKRQEQMEKINDK